MKKTLAFALLLTFLCGTAYAQTSFEKGYFITTEDTKVECLIKNEGWIGIPNVIEYRMDENGETNVLKKESLNKLYIEEKILLERHTVLLDKYSKNLTKLSNSRMIDAKEENVLLKVIADGTARLLRYDYEGVQYFFYQLDSGVKPLEYKLYKNSKNALSKNLNYQKTLREQLNCSNKEIKTNIKYKEKALVNYIKEYNLCFNNSNTFVYSFESKKSKFNIRAKLSVGQSKIEGRDSELSFKFGGEFEYVFPFNNNKWSAFIEPTYQSFSQDVGSNNFYETNYKSIEIPIGVRHYFFINSDNKIFTNGGFNLDWALNDYLIEKPTNLYEIDTTVNYFLGIGYELNNKYSLEFRYNTARDLTRLSTTTSNFINYSLKIGYNFL